MTNELTAADAARTDVSRAPESESAQLMRALISAAANPEVSAEKMGALFDLHQRIKNEVAKQEFDAALARASLNFTEVKRTGRLVIYSRADREYADKNAGRYPPNAKPIQNTPYAKFEDVVAAVVPALAAEGLHVSYDPQEKIVGDSLVITVTGVMTHALGYERARTTPSLPIDTSGSKNAIQARKSTISYGRKMALEMLTGVASRDEDDDGAAAGDPVDQGPDLITEAQYKELADEITAQSGKTLEAVLAAFGIESLGDLPASQFDDCKKRLAERRARTMGRRE